jgi:hypothetical protein
VQEKENIVVGFQKEQRFFDFVEVQSVNRGVCICRSALEDRPFPYSIEVSEESSSHFERRLRSGMRAASGTMTSREEALAKKRAGKTALTTE